MSIQLSPQQKQSVLWLGVGLALIFLLSALGPILMPFVVGAIIAYALNPWVDRLCGFKIRHHALPRPLAAGLCMIALFLILLSFVLMMAPIFQKAVPQIQSQIPQLVEKLNGHLSPLLNEFGIHTKMDNEGIKTLVSEHLASSGEVIGRALLSSLKVGGTAVLGLIANLVLIPIVLFYLLVDWHGLTHRVQKFIPRRWLKQSLTWVKEVDHLLAQYLRGQILVMVVLAFYYALGLSIAGFDLAIPVGVLTGLLVFIPYLGFGLGLFLALTSALLQFNNLHGILAVAIVYGLGQILEGFYLTPKLVGERIGLHPLTVIFALMAFGQLFGFIGFLIALPASAVVSVAVKHLRAAYLHSTFYQN